MTHAVSPGAPSLEALDWNIADRLRKIRRDYLGIDQSEFASQLGITRQAYAAWESGRNQPRAILAVARKIESLTGVPAAWVLGIEATAKPAPDAVRVQSSRRELASVTSFLQVTGSSTPLPSATARPSRVHSGGEYANAA